MTRLGLVVFVGSLVCLGAYTSPSLGQKSVRAVPAVDKDASAKFETATFALG